MSNIIVECPIWKAILEDQSLARARSRLSFHEIRLIINHARDSGSDPSGLRPERAQGEASQSGAEGNRPTSPAQPPTHGEGEVEILGEKLFALSAELKTAGLFDHGETNLTRAYERAVAAFQALSTTGSRDDVIEEWRENITAALDNSAAHAKETGLHPKEVEGREYAWAYALATMDDLKAIRALKAAP